MKSILLDTNIVIYLTKDVRYGLLYRRYLETNIAFISFMTVSELYEGAFRAGIETRRS